MSNFLSNHNIRNGARVLAAAGALYLGAAACSSEPAPSVKPESAPRVQPSTETTTVSTLPPEMTISESVNQNTPSAAEAYTLSAERNQRIDAQVQDAGARIVAAAETGVIGPFDFYNVQTKDWGRSAGNEGWGMLQHNPQYGGSEDQVSVMVYQDAAGNVDLTKGVKSLMFRDPNGSVEFTTPGGIFSVFDPEGPVTNENSWKVRVATHEDIAAGDLVGNESSEFTAYDTSLVDLQIVDYTADSLLRVFLETHEL